MQSAINLKDSSGVASPTVEPGLSRTVVELVQAENQMGCLLKIV
jgi:hypothetical protein